MKMSVVVGDVEVGFRLEACVCKCARDDVNLELVVGCTCVELSFRWVALKEQFKINFYNPKYAYYT